MNPALENISGGSWHDRHMKDIVQNCADRLVRHHGDQPVLLSAFGLNEPNRWRAALRQAGVPVLELNDTSPAQVSVWRDAAYAFSAEYLVPVVVFGANLMAGCSGSLALLSDGALENPAGQLVADADWLRARQVALTRGVETSDLNREFRRSRERHGWIRIGGCQDALLAEGNGLLLAWSSPLPLRRIRDFAARCPEITLCAADAEAIAQEVAAQGISVSGWRFAVK
jgi:hypothetical protein